MSQGRFLTPWDQNVVPQSPQLQAPPTRPPAVPGDDRSGSVHIGGRGTLMTYMFEVSLNLLIFAPAALHRLCRLPGASQYLPVLGAGLRRLAAAAAALGAGGGLRQS